MEQEDCYSVGDEDEDGDLDGFIVNDDKELEQTEESFDGKCLTCCYSCDGRIHDIAQMGSFSFLHFIFHQIHRLRKTQSYLTTAKMMTILMLISREARATIQCLLSPFAKQPRISYLEREEIREMVSTHLWIGKCRY